MATVRYSRVISTGKVLEYQGGGDPSNPYHLQAMRNNAESLGADMADLEVGYEEQSVIEALWASQIPAIEIWEEEMDKSDGKAPRYLEDIYDVLTQSQKDAMSSHVKGTKVAIEAKKTLRATKPI